MEVIYPKMLKEILDFRNSPNEFCLDSFAYMCLDHDPLYMYKKSKEEELKGFEEHVRLNLEIDRSDYDPDLRDRYRNLMNGSTLEEEGFGRMFRRGMELKRKGKWAGYASKRVEYYLGNEFSTLLEEVKPMLLVLSRYFSTRSELLSGKHYEPWVKALGSKSKCHVMYAISVPDAIHTVLNMLSLALSPLKSYDYEDEEDFHLMDGDRTLCSFVPYIIKGTSHLDCTFYRPDNTTVNIIVNI